MSAIDSNVTLFIKAVSSCPLCAKQVEMRKELDEQWMTDHKAKTLVSALRSDLRDELTKRGWSPVMCGACRDRSPVGIVSETLGKAGKDLTGDDDCG